MQSMATVTSIQSPRCRKRACRSSLLPRTAAGARKSPAQRLLVFGLDDFFTAVIAVGADVVTQMHLSGRGFDRQRRRRQMVVRPVHAALRRRLLVLLNC